MREGVEAGQLGGSFELHGEQAMGFVSFSKRVGPFEGHVVDLGSGVGLPAIPLADSYPSTTWSLIERRASRVELLRRTVSRLRLAARIEVFDDDAGEAAWGPLRGSAEWVTARSFGPPAVTAELGCAFLRPAGQLLVSESRDADIAKRWPAEGLERCGLRLAEVWEVEAGRFVRLERTASAVDELPRRGARKVPIF